MSTPIPTVYPTITTTTPLPPLRLLLLNPNSTSSMTLSCLTTLQPTLPPNVTITGFTAPHPSPSAIEGHLDANLSTSACIRAVIPYLQTNPHDGILVACFSHHPLIAALREELTIPIIGIMEASLYAARMLGSRLGVLATGQRSVVMHEDSIRYYGFSHWSAGVESAGLGVLELEDEDQERVLGKVGDAARRLRDRGVDCIALGCAGMAGMREKCVEEVGGDGDVMILDGVRVGIQFLAGLCREGLQTAKGGAYRSSKVGRESRGQDWL